MKEFGLNLYSLRNMIQTEKELESTIFALMEMGYTYFQFSGAPFDADMIERVSKRTGAPFVLTHVPLDGIVGDVDALMAEHAKFGCRNIGLGSIPWNVVKDENELKKTLDALCLSAEKMKKNGFKFFYHNHHVEFTKHGKKTVLDIILERIPSLNVTLDTYWVQYGGADVCETVKKLAGKIGCVHLKDYAIKISSDGKFEPSFAPLGEGNLDFGKIIPEMKRAGTEYFLVEMDNAAEANKPLELIAPSAKYLKSFEV